MTRWQKAQEILKRVPHDFGAAIALMAMSVAILLVSFQMNFQQQSLRSQVLMVGNEGQQELVSFDQYRFVQSQKLQEQFSECLQINELFGDGTGEECEDIRDRLNCVEDAYSQTEVLNCEMG